MAEQYWVGDFFIDLSRNQITQKMQSRTIPPKALAVLTCLAKNANKVVSHDELLSEVWPDTVVTPNTLQRSIAQLRKALGEDSQIQSYIKTHAKQGYSLECEVRWQDKIDAESLIDQEHLLITNSTETDPVTPETVIENSTPIAQNESADTAKTSTPALGLMTILVGMVLLAFIGVTYFSSTESYTLSFTELRSLTATDNKEFGAIYTPDGEYIVFNRYSEKLCVESNIWAKNIKTQKETQLTTNMGRYDAHSFSKDGKKLVFVKTENCDQQITQKNCYKLMTLDFEQALAAPQSPTVLMECKNSRIRKATWLNNNDITLLQMVSDRWKLASYSITDNKSTVIYELEDGNIVDYDYSVTDDLIALTSIHNDGQNYIETLKPDGQVLSSHPIEYPPEIANLRFISPNFTPTSEQLIFSTGRQLFTLSFAGKITNISLPLDEPMGSPIFHPDGKRMLVIKGNWDSDIARIPLSQIAKLPLAQTQVDQVVTKESNNYSIATSSILERSTLAEDNAIFQPHGELIVFKSDRSGEDQLWLTDGNGSQQLTHFPTDTFINGLGWTADGESILVNANNVLTQVNLDSSQKAFPFSHRVEQLFQWNSEDNTALLNVRIKGVLTFAEFNLHNSALSVINDKKVNHALKTEDGRLIYTDHMDRYWQPGPAEDQLIEALVDQGSDKGFIIKNNVIYGINETSQLWSYDLNKATFELLGNLPDKVDFITDINQTDLLMTMRITAKKEVAELFLKE